MQRLSLIGFCLATLFCAASAYSAVTIEWKYHNSQSAGWIYLPDNNQHGGHDFWCIHEGGSDCGLWDWRSVYPGVHSPTELDPVLTSMQFGHQNVLDAAELNPNVEGPQENQYPVVEIQE